MVAEIRRGRTLEQVAAARGLTVETTGPFTRMDPNRVFGIASPAVGAAFGTPLNQVSGVVETTGGLFLIRPVARTGASQAEFNRDKAGLRQMLIGQLRQQAVQRWLDSVRRAAKIRDNRDQMMGRA